MESPQRVYFWIALLFGIPVVFAILPFGGFDETGHYWRAIQLAEGQLVAQLDGKIAGGYFAEPFAHVEPLPSEKGRIRWKTLWRALIDEKPVDWNHAGPLKFRPTASLYSPVPYLPHILAVWLGKAFHFGGLRILYFARLLGCLTVIAIFYGAIRIIPDRKWVIVLIGLSPMNLFVAGTVSADPLTTALSVLLLALGYRAYVRSDAPLTAGEIASLFAVSLGLSLCKTAYLFLPLTLIALLYPRFKARWHWLSFGANLGVLCFGTSAVWSRMCHRIFYPVTPETVDPVRQLQFVRAHPLHFLKSFFRTFGEYGGFYTTQVVGQFDGLQLSLGREFYYLFPMFFFGAACLFASRKKLPAVQKLCLATAACLSIGSIALGFYLVWSPVGADGIGGIQGRYFLPVVPFLALSLPSFPWVRNHAVQFALGTATGLYSAIALLERLRMAHFLH